MANNYFNFKQFTINQQRSAFKVGTDGVLLGAYADTEGVKRILDIGTGTGLIALMLAQRSDAEITGIEPDYESCQHAIENVRNSKWGNRIHILNTDFQYFSCDSLKFDLIVTNPPFFSGSLKNPDNRKSVSRHNDKLPGEDILAGTLKFLDDNGRLQLILPVPEAKSFLEKAVEYGFYCNDLLKIKPTEKSDIKRLILSFSRKKSIITEKLISIETDERHRYSAEYINLTKEYYLNL